MAQHKELMMRAAQQQLDGPVEGTLEIVGRMDPFTGNLNETVIVGGRLYGKGYSDGGITIINITDPTDPIAITTYYHEPDFSLLTFRNGLAVYGNYLMAGSPTGIALFDVSNDQVVHLETVSLTADRGPSVLYVENDRLYAIFPTSTSSVGVVHVFDLTTLPTVTSLGSGTIPDYPGSPKGLNELFSGMVSGVAYFRNAFGSSDNIVFGVDCSVPGSPTITGSITFAHTQFGSGPGYAALSADGNTLYLGGRESQNTNPWYVKVVDTATMTETAHLGDIQQRISSMGLIGDTLYVGGGDLPSTYVGLFAEIDVSTPSSPTVTQNVSSTTAPVGSIVFKDNNMFLGSFGASAASDVLGVYDRSVLGSPSPIGGIPQYPSQGAVVDFTVDGNVLYLIDWDNGRIFSVDITQRENPEVLDLIADNDGGRFYGQGMTVLGDRLFIKGPQFSAPDTIEVVDVSDPNSMTLLGVIESGDSFDGLGQLEAVGTHVIGTSIDSNKLFAFDGTSSPIQPAVVYDVTLPNEPNGLAIHGDFAVVACQGAGRVAMVDISDPTAIGAATVHQSPVISGGCTYVVVYGDHAFVTSQWNSGVVTALDITDPANITVVGTYDSPDFSYLPAKPWLHQNFLVVASFNDSMFNPEMECIDISDPANMVRADLLLLRGVSMQTTTLVVASLGDFAYAISQRFPMFYAVEMT